LSCRQSCHSPESKREERLGSGITDPGPATGAAGIRPTTATNSPGGSPRRARRRGAAPSQRPTRQAGQQRGARMLSGLAPSSPDRAARGDCRHGSATSRSLEAFAACGHTAPAHTAIDPAGCGGQGQSTPICRAEPPYPGRASWAPLRCPRYLASRRPFRSASGWMSHQPQPRRLDPLARPARRKSGNAVTATARCGVGGPAQLGGR
jgi:hypothetical protein